MKNSAKTLTLLTLGLFTFLASANTVQTQNSVWVAKLSGKLQCDERVIHRTNLGDAISDLEKDLNADVEQAVVSKIDGRLFCSACQCPDGSFFVAQVKLSDASSNDLPAGWEIVNPRTVSKLQPSNKDTEPTYKTQPIVLDR